MALALLAPLAGPAAGTVLALMSLEPAASADALFAQHEAFLGWAAASAGLSPEDVAALRSWFRTAAGDSRRGVPVPSLSVDALRSPGTPTTWSAAQPRPAPNHSWAELAASGAVLSGAALAYVLELIFTEDKSLTRYNDAVQRDPGKELFSFRARAAASNCVHLVPPLAVDQSVAAATARTWADPPRKRLAAAASELHDGPARMADTRAVRSPQAILREAAMRSVAASVMGSWRSYASGLRCWSAYMDACHPSSPHFPAQAEHLRAFAPFFQNGDTLQKYVSHVHLGERLLGLDPAIRPPMERAIIRGAKKGSPRVEGPCFRRDDAARLVRAAVAKGRVDLARLFAVARAWLLRVPNEGLPLQANGRRFLPADALAWHSQVVLLAGRPRPRLRIVWRTRKNCPAGDSSERTCSCTDDPDSWLLCGPCALLSQMELAVTSGRSPADPLFPGLQGSAARSLFAAVASSVGLPPAWHAFRRGMAQDMLSRGDPLAEILLAGGWRSGAFLRYLSRQDLDRRVALEFAMAASGDEA